ncbi:MAG: beta-ketoacyl synthase [Bacteroidia bacterium]|nr:beta-ketoacyl synthase [Bacteroidia bacterium]
MKEVYVISDNMITSLGFTTLENFNKLSDCISGIRICQDTNLSPTPVPLSIIDSAMLKNKAQKAGIGIEYTRLEQLHLLSVSDALSFTNINASSADTLFIFSGTKGNIDLLEEKAQNDFGRARIFLWKAAEIICSYFNNPNRPLIISCACISGVIAIYVASLLIRKGLYKNVIVSGADIIAEFVISGFQSLKAISSEPCKPFDSKRNGLTLGEGCGSIILSSDPSYCTYKEKIIITGGGSSNDANHISGPSRTGDGLFFAIQSSLKEANLKSCEIDFISAHGTATPYNDEMEAKALVLAGLEGIPVNSMKGYFGHTPGAAGVLESIIAVHSMNENILFKTAGFTEIGVPGNINIIKETTRQNIKICLKTASGFGGFNGAIILKKILTI